MMLDKLTPRSEQESAIQQVLADKSHLCRGETGAGKTLIGVEAVLRTHARITIVICPLNTFSSWTKTFQCQSAGRVTPRVIDGKKDGKLAFESLVLREQGVYLLSWERFRMYDWKKMPLDFVIVDECFIAGTPIQTPNGPRAVETLKEGDVVYGFDHTTGQVVETQVKATMQSRSNKVLPNGATANHPYFVAGDGYRPLADLTPRDEVLQIVDTQDTPAVRRVRLDVLSEGPADVLQPEMLSREQGQESHSRTARGTVPTAETAVHGSTGTACCGVREDAPAGAVRSQVSCRCAGAHDYQEPRCEPGDTTTGAGHQAATGGHLRAPEWGQWGGTDTLPEDAGRGVGLADGGCGCHRQEASGVSDRVQVGHIEPTPLDRGGVRRADAQDEIQTGAGQEEDRTAGVEGVAHLEILEPRDRERFERVRGASAGGSVPVYNIETGTGNYFAQGVLVHNCHRQQNRRAGTHESIMTTVHAEYKLALSATPWGNHIQGAWAAIRWLWYGNDEVVGRNDSFWNWVTIHMTTSLDKFSGKKVEKERVPGTVWASLPSKSFFPSPFQEQPIIHEILVPLMPAQRKIYDRFEQEAIVWLDEHPLVADLPAVMRVRLRQICLAVPSIRFEWLKVPDKELMDEKFNWDRWEMEERENGWYAYKEVVYFEEDAKSTKADAMIDQINDLYAAGPVPIIIFTHSEKFATMFTKRLQAKGFNALRFVGGMPSAEREWKKENFGKEFDILVCSIATVSEGTDGIQDVCNIEFWVSLEDNRLLNHQCKGRCSRPGQKKTVQRFMFLAENTVEVKQIGKQEADQAQLDESFTPLEEMESA